MSGFWYFSLYFVEISIHLGGQLPCPTEIGPAATVLARKEGMREHALSKLRSDDRGNQFAT